VSQYAFPATLPAAEFQEIAVAAAGGNFYDKGLLLPAWVVQGYVEGKVAGLGSRLVGDAPAAMISDADLAGYLMDATKHRVGGLSDAALAMLPWRSIALALAKFVVKVLES
jgi:hypothetical protein